MSNIINNLLLNEVSTTSSTTSSTEGTKETPSLFDSLLSSATLSKEVSSEKNTSATIVKDVKTDDLKIENPEIEIAKDINISPKETETNKIEPVIEEEKVKVGSTSTSLLDRLLIEVKNDVTKNGSVPTNNTLSLKTNLENDTLNNVISIITTDDVPKIDIGDVPEVAVSVDLSEKVEIEVKETPTEAIVVKDNKEDTTKEATNNTTSTLLDKLVIEAKKDANKINNDLNNVSSIITTDDVPKIDIGDVPEVAVSVDLPEKVEIEVKETPTEAIVVKDNKEDTTKEATNNTTSTLLDKLVIEAKKDANKINNDLNNVSSIITTDDVPKIDIGDVPEVAVSVDLSEKVEIEVKETPTEAIVVKDNKEDTTKEATNNTTSTLLDKLVIEAKKDANKINNDLNNVSSIITTDDVPKIDIGDVPEVVVSADLPEKVEIVNSNNKIEDNSVSTDENKSFENIEIVDIKVNEQLSLMDKLIQKTTEKIIAIDTNNITVETTTTNVIPKDLITNIYLGSQKNQLNNQSLFNKSEAISLLKEGNSVQAIKVSADMLELGLENIDVQQIKDDKLEIKKTVIDVVDRKNMIDNILSQKNVKSEEVKNLITQSVEASKALLENELNLADDSVVNVNSPLSYNIQSKIIGAKQQMATMMSDIAKQMYENYKPPVTAFRINLNPTELGSIAILMKSDKNSGLSISLNASNSITLDTLVENQNVLKNSLSKTFNENTKFNLDFNSSNENNSNQSSNNQNNQQNNRRFDQQIDTQSILKLQEENKNIEEKILDYM